jgi:hypothetical protein
MASRYGAIHRMVDIVERSLPTRGQGEFSSLFIHRLIKFLKHLLRATGRHRTRLFVVGYQTFGVRLTVASHQVYSYRPRIPWIKAATLSAFCSIAV